MVNLDDATSEVYSAFLVKEEGTASSLRGLAEVVASRGLFCASTPTAAAAISTPRPPAGKVSRTQVGRAPQRFGIEHIAAYSPEARGRSERVFRTLQDRLPKELRLVGITGIAAANRCLAGIIAVLGRGPRRCRIGYAANFSERSRQEAIHSITSAAGSRDAHALLPIPAGI